MKTYAPTKAPPRPMCLRMLAIATPDDRFAPFTALEAETMDSAFCEAVKRHHPEREVRK